MNHDPESGKPRWAPRVRMNDVRHLYQGEARGLLDRELLDEIGTTLFCRCESILIASDAARGRVYCPRCDTIIRHRGDDKDRIIACGCGWRIRWGDYLATYQHKDLWGGGFVDAMREFMAHWPVASSPRAKMLLVDRLLHLWHWQFSPERSASRPAAPAFIEGSRRKVIAFLDELGGVP